MNFGIKADSGHFKSGLAASMAWDEHLDGRKIMSDLSLTFDHEELNFDILLDKKRFREIEGYLLIFDDIDETIGDSQRWRENAAIINFIIWSNRKSFWDVIYTSHQFTDQSLRSTNNRLDEYTDQFFWPEAWRTSDIFVGTKKITMDKHEMPHQIKVKHQVKTSKGEVVNLPGFRIETPEILEIIKLYRSYELVMTAGITRK